VVASELVSSNIEVPDAIGWLNAGKCSVLIECKTSRSDFLADAKKMFRRRQEHGMGRYRFYMAPVGLLAADEMPEHWGLLEVRGRAVDVAKVAEMYREYNWRAEMAMLWSIARRAQAS